MREILLPILAAALTTTAAGAREGVTFTKDVAPIFQKHCQTCHRPGEVAPMSLLTYDESRPWAKAIREAVITKRMPPWLPDPNYGHFRNDTSLAQKEIDTLVTWADAGAPKGDPKDMPEPIEFEIGWNIGTPDAVIEMPKPYEIPAEGVIDIVYMVLPTNFKEDRWIKAAEIRPGNRALVHHVNAYVRTRDPNSKDTRRYGETSFGQKYSGTPPASARQPVSSALVGYVPGYQHKSWSDGQAKLIPAGADLVLQLHYTTNGKAGLDQTKVGMVFADEKIEAQVVSAVAKSWTFRIPAGASNHEVKSFAELARPAQLVSLHPHMHYRGKDYQYEVIYPDGRREILLRIPRWDFNWQMTYHLAEPKFLPAGTRIECTAHYDNSPNNPENPDPTVDVTYGEQSWDEMMSGWVEVAFDPSFDKNSLFTLKDVNDPSE